MTEGNKAIPNKYGHPLSVPRRPSTPSIWDIRSPTVTASWFIVPNPPRSVNGAISEMYMGTKDVFKPKIEESINRYRKSVLRLSSLYSLYLLLHVLLLTTVNSNEVTSHNEQFVQLGNF